MKLYLLIPLAFTLSCNTVKTAQTPVHSDQLMKDIQTLSSDMYEGRKTGTKGGEMAGTYITKRFKETGLKSFPLLNSYQQPFNFEGIDDPKITGKNIIGYIPGTSDKIIVISAHYDHLGVINGQIFNGADDNASGVAGMLKIAAYFTKNKPVYTLIFAAFDAEEFGRKGSAYFIDHLPLDIKRIKLNINLDMISHNDKGELYASGTFKNPQLKTYIVTSEPDIKILFGHDNPKLGIDDWTNQSDQSAFNEKGIPFIYFGVEDHKDYHKESDKFENINQPFFISAVNAILEITNRVDKNITLESIARQKDIMRR
jgi:Zn-dependent M28 family amino/carboxypeptidase